MTFFDNFLLTTLEISIFKSSVFTGKLESISIPSVILL